MIVWDAEAIKRDTDCRELVRDLGLAVSGSLSRDNVPMICLWHSEHKHDNCYATKEYVHCFSCGSSGDCFKVVERYRELNGGDTSFSSVCEFLADRLGLRDNYIKETKGDKYEKEKKKSIPFLPEELQDIGISVNRRFSEGKYISLPEIFEKDEDYFWHIVYSRSDETVEEMSKILEKMRYDKGFDKGIVRECQRRIVTARNILRTGGYEPEMFEFFVI